MLQGFSEVWGVLPHAESCLCFVVSVCTPPHPRRCAGGNEGEIGSAAHISLLSLWFCFEWFRLCPHTGGFILHLPHASAFTPLVWSYSSVCPLILPCAAGLCPPSFSLLSILTSTHCFSQLSHAHTHVSVFDSGALTWGFAAPCCCSHVSKNHLHVFWVSSSSSFF